MSVRRTVGVQGCRKTCISIGQRRNQGMSNGCLLGAALGLGCVVFFGILVSR